MKSWLAVAIVALLVLPTTFVQAGPTVRNPELRYGETVTLDTDATAGTIALYKPATEGTSCWTQVMNVPAPYDGQLRSIQLDRAGVWRLDHTQGSTTQSTHLTVLPRDLRILVTARPNTDFDVQVARGPTQVPYAYLDVYYGDALVRHLRTDAAGQATIHSSMLPYAGVYRLTAYRDLGSPAFVYSNAYVPQQPAPCDGTYNAPEEWADGSEVGQGFSAVTKDTVPLELRVIQGPIQVRHIQSTSTVRVTTPDGAPLLPSRWDLLVNGLRVTPASIGLAIDVQPGRITLQGTWDASADVVLELVADSNADGVPEYNGLVQIPVRADLPMRLVPVLPDGSPDPEPRLAYRVPAPNPDGTPGRHVLRFKVYDLDGHEGRPPVPSNADVAIKGDLLPGASVGYDAAAGYWVATATPTSSDSDYRITIDWAHVGQVTAVVDMPRDGGARTSQVHPDGNLVVNKRSDAVVRVDRFNPAAISHHACTPLPSCAYEPVTDGHVRLAWMDTGKPVLDPAGRVYEYYPGRAPSACSCYEYQGEYNFQNLLLNRSGTLLAIAKINVPGSGGMHAYSYAALRVEPEPVYTPTLTPSRTLAGQFQRYAITSSGLSGTTLDEFEVRLLDAQGRNVAEPGNFSVMNNRVFLSAVLPEGKYSLVVQDRLDPFDTPPKLGKKGTLTPGTLLVTPADVRFAYTETPTFPSTLGVDLRDALNATYVLGDSLGAIVQLRVDAYGPEGQRAPGILRLEGFDSKGGAARAFALLAYSDKNQPTTVGAPRLYGPDDPELAWMCDDPTSQDPDLDDCGSYYFAELPTPHYSMALHIPYNAQPVLIYVYGVATGDVRVSFLPAGSNLNREEPTHSTIHIVPPSARATGVHTDRGSTEKQLAVGMANLVEVEAWDPTGYNVLEGLEVALRRSMYGPSQVPGGILHYQGAIGMTHVAVVPDASGPLGIYVIQGEAMSDTRHRLVARPASEIAFNTTSIRLFVDLTAHANEGAAIPVRVGTSADPFPQGATVRAFGVTVALVSGTGTIHAPFVDQDTEFPVELNVPGLAPAIRSIRIVDTAHQVRNMQASGIPTTVKEGQSFAITVRDGNTPLGAAQVQLLGFNTTTDPDGQATVQAPLVKGPMDAWLTLSRSNYTTLQFPIQITDTGNPQLAFEVQRTMEGGNKYTITVRATDERDRPTNVPATLSASIEAQRATRLQFAGHDGASWTYEAPRLTQDIRIYAFAHAPGYESAMTIITIRGST
jgi:hypothetical protein